ncbi:hypothetical protein [uncultured Microbulbifer sp.]|uniref:hypothetical protein n=1 Tax=uncultured Microbulbifer sp. TaxID=348147 RepID=UPI0026071330|nr:hypothetical protein [uncultured Microbulbifer sp.]
MANLTEQQAEELARKTAHQAVEEVLQKLGVDVANVLEMQKDLAHLRQQRKAAEQVGVWTRRIFLGIFITSVCATLWAGFLSGLKGSN